MTKAIILATTLLVAILVYAEEQNVQTRVSLLTIRSHNWKDSGVTFESTKVTPSPGEQPGLGYSFVVKNVSTRTISWLEVTAWLMSSDGHLKGFAGHGSIQTLRPGGTLYQHSFTDNPIAEGDDIILIVPEEVHYGARVWKAPEYNPSKLFSDNNTDVQ